MVMDGKVTTINDNDDDLVWDVTREQDYVSVKEPIEWLSCHQERPPDKTELLSFSTQTDVEWLCSNDLIVKLTKCKETLFHGCIPTEVLNNARRSANPFESIGKGDFLNRSAMKMANIDAAFDFMFTGHEDTLDDVLFFADVCGGPGGFSEYVLWRTKDRKHKTKGFGITLKGDLDFRLDKFLAQTGNRFHIEYGSKGDGNIYSPENLISFRDRVMKDTNNHGVHFVMADGSFSLEGEQQHLHQENLHQRLYLCQAITALSVLEEGGHFVCKLFDTLTPFTVSLIYLMYRSFDSVCLFKPNTSRPATSEKYLVCRGMKSGTDSLRNYLCDINIKMNDKAGAEEVASLIPIHVMKEDNLFHLHILEANVNLVRRQIFFLNKMLSFAQHSALRDHRQQLLANICLKKWKILSSNKNHSRGSRKRKPVRL